MAKTKEIKKGKSFHKLRPLRLDDETWMLMNKHKKGTWNYYLKNIMQQYEQNKRRALPEV